MIINTCDTSSLNTHTALRDSECSATKFIYYIYVLYICILLCRCQEDLASRQSSHDDRIRGMSQELVARDLKLQTLEDMCDKLREDVRKRDADIEQ